MKNKKKKMGRMGFGASEFLSSVVVLIILTAIILKIATNHSENEKFHAFKYHVSTLLFNSNAYELTHPAVDNLVFLHELFQNQVIDSLDNPFQSNESCNRYESMVFLNDTTGDHIFTLQCGKYVIYKQHSSDRKYRIYSASDWQLESISDSSKYEVDREIRYNYKDGETFAFTQYYTETLFLRLFNERNQTEYYSISSIPDSYQVDRQTFYRTRKLIKTIAAY